MSSEEEDEDKSINEDEEEESEENSKQKSSKKQEHESNINSPKTPPPQNNPTPKTGSHPSKINSPKQEQNIEPPNTIPPPIESKPPEELEKELLIQSNIQLEIDNQNLSQKLSKLKQSVIDVKSRLDNETLKDFFIQQKTISDLDKALKESNRTILYMQAQLKKKVSHQADISVYNTRYEMAVIENKDIEELIARQDEEIKKYTLYNIKSSNELAKETNKIKNHEKNVTAIKTAIFESEQTIKKLKERIDKKEYEEKKRQQLIEDKDKEIEMILSFIDSHKTQITLNAQNEQNLVNQIRRVKQESKKLNIFLNKQTTPIKNDSIINKNDNINKSEDMLNEKMSNELKIEESHLKEITGLMQQVIDD